MESAMNNNNNCRTETSAKDVELFTVISTSQWQIETAINGALMCLLKNIALDKLKLLFCELS